MNSSDNKWLERFFSGRNVLKWQDITNGSIPYGWSDDIIPWIQATGDGSTDLPLVLPCLNDDGTVTWYAGCNSDRCAQRLSEELMAFIGPSYSDYKQHPYVLDMSDEIESSFAEGCTYKVFRFSPTHTNRIPAIRDSLKRYRNLIGRYKKSDLVIEQSFSVIRGEFDRALLVGDESQARIKYEQLLRTGRLSADNRLYLEVRLLAGLGHWPQIAGDTRLLRALSDLALPPRVLVDVIEALYRVYIESVENTSEPQVVLQAFRDAGLNQYKRLFATRRGLILPRVLKAFFLYELCREKPDTKRLETVVELLIGEEDNGFNTALRSLIPKQVIPGPSINEQNSQADMAFDDDDYERALDLYIELPPSIKRLRRMLSCARVIGDRGTVEKVLTVIDQQHTADINTLSQSASETLEKLRQLVELPKAQEGYLTDEDSRDGWLQWAHLVAAGLKSSDAKDILQDSSVNWDTRNFAETPSLLDELAAVMGNAEGSVASVFREAYPYFFEAFVLDAEKPVSAFKPLLNVLLTNTVLLDAPSQDELELVRQLTDALITIGLTKKEYDELISDLSDLLSYQSSLFTLSWALDVCEILTIYSCSSPESRLRFILMVLDLARKVSHRLSSIHSRALELLCLDVGIELPAELIKEEQEDESKTARQYLANKKIAIYTLTEQAGKRAIILLKQLCPDVSVELNSDKVCTEKLRALAKHADIFVFAWKSSSHQAFYCIKDHRPDGWSILQPLGKGSSSIIREVIELTINN